MTNLQKTIAAYRTSQIASGLSPSTISSYGDSLAQYSNFCTAQNSDPFRQETLLAWKSHLSEKNKMSSVSLRMVHIDAFMKFAAEFHYTKENPCTKSIKKTKKAASQPYKNLLSSEEIISLLTSPTCPKGMTKANFPRNLAIITLLLTSAARNSELRNLSPNDLDWTAGKLCLSETKGGKYREAPFPARAQAAVKTYLAGNLRPKNATDEDYLFGTLTNGVWQKMSRQGLSALVERHVRLVTSHEGERSHALRHASASYMLTNGVSLDVLKELLGHADDSTTRIYSERLIANSATDVANKVFENLAAPA